MTSNNLSKEVVHSAARRSRRNSIIGKIAIYLVLTIYALVIVFPFSIVLITSILSPKYSFILLSIYITSFFYRLLSSSISFSDSSSISRGQSWDICPFSISIRLRYSRFLSASVELLPIND